jgi:hypothetical protein
MGMLADIMNHPSRPYLIVTGVVIMAIVGLVIALWP